MQSPLGLSHIDKWIRFHRQRILPPPAASGAGIGGFQMVSGLAQNLNQLSLPALDTFLGLDLIKRFQI